MIMLDISLGTSDGPMGSCLSQPRPLASPFDQVLFHGNLSRRPRDYQCMVPPSAPERQWWIYRVEDILEAVNRPVRTVGLARDFTS